MTRFVKGCRKAALVGACGMFLATGAADVAAAPQAPTASAVGAASLGFFPGAAAGAGFGLIAGALVWFGRRRRA